jgi:hypothetical protein
VNQESTNLFLPPELRQAFRGLPWEICLSDWKGHCQNLVQVDRGLSRHPVEFVNIEGDIFAIKEMPSDLAVKEYAHLIALQEMRLPAVSAVGYVVPHSSAGERSLLITRFLDRSLPYRSLFISGSLSSYRDHLLDAMAGLLVQLHLVGVFWGDCSLSNTLFRRDAGTLQAYLVDAETVERNPGPLSPTLRHHDLQIMEENVGGDLADLSAQNLLMDGLPLDDTSGSIRVRYQNLWEQINNQIIIHPNEKFRIHERIQAINSLGFSISEVIVEPLENGDKISFEVVVTDRYFHRDQLLGLTGIEAEEMQARLMMNEIQEIKANLSQANNRSTPVSLAAYNWLHEFYQPAINQLQPLISHPGDSAELYCQILEHKWYLSEAAQHDVGHRAAVEDFLQNISPA